MTESADEIEAVGIMIEKAEKQGLLAEVVWSFGQEMRNEKDMVQAAANALYDWDI